MTFPGQLKDLRSRLDWTQAEAAAYCEEPLRTWADWERGKTTPKPAHQEGIIARLERALPQG